MNIDQIVLYHRQEREGVKGQSQIDRRLEAFIRRNVFGFSTLLAETQRKEITAKTTQLIKQCRAVEASDQYRALVEAIDQSKSLIKELAEAVPEQYIDIAEMVLASDLSRLPWDGLRASREAALEKLAKRLPAAKFIDTVPGAGLKGLAQIVGEAGDLSNYPNPGKLWKRLGLAPYDGLAMSTWMRPSWRPRKLEPEEWIANPFKQERYAIVAQIAQWIWVKQWVGKEKVVLTRAAIEANPRHSDEAIAPLVVQQEGKNKGKQMVTADIVKVVRDYMRLASADVTDGIPNGYYGEVYAYRRAHTAKTHPEWYLDSEGKEKRDEYGNPTSLRAHRDAMRYMMKRFIRNLWRAWRDAVKEIPANGWVSPTPAVPEAPASTRKDLKPISSVSRPARRSRRRPRDEGDEARS